MINQNVAYLRSRSSARALTALSKESGIRSSSCCPNGSLRRREESSLDRVASCCFVSDAICKRSITPCSTQWLDGQFLRPLARPVLSLDNSRLLLRQQKSSPGKFRERIRQLYRLSVHVRITSSTCKSS